MIWLGYLTGHRPDAQWPSSQLFAQKASLVLFVQEVPARMGPSFGFSDSRDFYWTNPKQQEKKKGQSGLFWQVHIPSVSTLLVCLLARAASSTDFSNGEVAPWIFSDELPTHIRLLWQIFMVLQEVRTYLWIPVSKDMLALEHSYSLHTSWLQGVKLSRSS